MTNPRIIVSHATFDTEESVKVFQTQTSNITSEEHGNSREAHMQASLEEQSKQTWLQSATSWAPELVWCLLSVILLMGLVMVLSTFDSRPLPDLPLGLTLNTVVAILATASRAVTVFLIGQGISQMKWNQYVGRDRPLNNLHVFDEASRGPWGSLQMVLRTRGNILAFLASFLIISSLASSTLTQSAIAYTPTLVADQNLNAKAGYCDAYPCGDAQSRNKDIQDRWVNKLEAAAFGAVFTHANQNLQPLTPQCQSAECRWAGFDTLGVCFEMRNITDRLDVNVTQNGTGIFGRQINKASVMDGRIFIREEDEKAEYRSTETANITVFVPDSAIPLSGTAFDFPYPRESVGFEDQKQLLDTTLSHFFLMFNNVHVKFENAARKYRAVEVIMHFCVQTLDVAVGQGEASTKSVKSHTRVSRVHESTMTIGFEDKGDPWYYEISSEDNKTDFRILEYSSLEANLADAMSGFYTADRGISVSEIGQMTRQLGLKMFHDLDTTSKAEEADKKVWENLENIFATLAMGITNYMRETGREENGTALASVTFVEVRWEWLTLVAAQVVLSIAFLLAVVIGTARLGVDVVKSSNMAELFAMQELDCNGCSKASGGESRAEGVVYGGIKTEVGKDIEATLRRDDAGWRLEVKPKVVGV